MGESRQEAIISYEIEAENVEYLRHGGTPLLARLYRPQGAGTFSIRVELHGGAWWSRWRSR